MNKSGGMRLILVSFFAAAGIIAYRDIKNAGHAPTPAEFMGAGVVYSLASIIGEFAPNLGATFAVGWTLGLVFNIVQNPLGSTSPKTGSNSPIGGGKDPNYEKYAGPRQPYPLTTPQQQYGTPTAPNPDPGYGTIQ